MNQIDGEGYSLLSTHFTQHSEIYPARNEESATLGCLT